MSVATGAGWSGPPPAAFPARPRVLHFIPGMGGGGAERQLTYLARPLIEYGWDVHVALASGGPNLPRLQQSGAIVHQLTPVTNYDPRLLWQVANAIRRVRPHVIQTWFLQMDVVAGGLASLFRIPWIFSERSSTLAYPPTWKNRLRVAIARRADAIVSNSAGGDAYWRDRSGPEVLRFTIPNALPLEEIESARPALPAELPVSVDEAVVLSVGRFDREKNVERLFMACREVVRRPKTVVVLCGEGPLLEAIRHGIAAHGLADRIFAPGYVGDLWPLMKRANVVIAPAVFEGRPNAVLETMAAGRPLVVSDIPAHREILAESSALWVDPEDPGAIAAAICQALDRPTDAEQRALRAQSRAQRWSIAGVAAEYHRAYTLIVSRRNVGLTSAGR